MKLLVIAGVLVLSQLVAAVDWEGYKNQIYKFEKMGIFNDPEYIKSRSASTRAIPFPCSPIAPSASTPTSVHKLRPSDIKVIGAIGDSLTAANGAKASLLTSLLTEYRGVSWSMGGDGDINSVTTLPNILRKYNPNLKGFSLGTGSYTTAGAKFNVAQPGHTSNEMFAQAQELVKRIKGDATIDFNNDWKMITLFVGGNDLCKFCKDESKYQPERYMLNLRDTLDYFKANLPRTFVNFVLTLDVKGIEILNNGFVCKSMHNYLCDCGITTANADKLNYLVSNYQRLSKQLIESGRYDNSDDFTVVLQPFMEEMKPPTLANGNPDYSYFAPDCFHFSVKGHETAALDLWNNMMQPVGKKTAEWQSIIGIVECPTESSPYLYTNKNSN